jgi:myosin heavy subunit
MAKSVNGNQSTSRIILVIAGILVLSALGYFATRYFSERGENEEKELTIENMDREIQELEGALETLKSDSQMALADKDKTIEENEERIKDLLAQVNRYKRQKSADLGTIKDLQTRLETTQRELARYREEINALKAENADLNQKVDSLAATEDQLRSENEMLAEQNQATVTELQTTKELASALKTRDFRFINVRGNKEKPDTEFRRLGLKDLKVCFTVIENMVAEPGDRDLYLVMENPDGTINANFSDNYSGKFSYEGSEKAYSAKTTIAFNRISQEVCILYSPAEENKYEKGVYYVSVFTEDNMIGQGTFRVK